MHGNRMDFYSAPKMYQAASYGLKGSIESSCCVDDVTESKLQAEVGILRRYIANDTSASCHALDHVCDVSCRTSRTQHGNTANTNHAPAEKMIQCLDQCPVRIHGYGKGSEDVDAFATDG